jgi:5-(carboxyamino)imidazole ribonucleotide synthase
MLIGVLGGGQLGRMLAIAGHPLGIRCRFFDPNAESPAGHVGDLIVGSYDDKRALSRFAKGLELVTYEFESVPVVAAEHLAKRAPVYPAALALATAQDRLIEKTFFTRLGIPTAPFRSVTNRETLLTAVKEIGLPAVLKTTRLGYDGKGQTVLREHADVVRAWEELGRAPLILEGFVEFQRELSIIAVRGRDGETGYYPLVENVHREGILRTSVAPAPGVSNALQQEAERYAYHVLNALDYVGVVAIELFDCGSRLVANEMAPRVHNSGHWTIEGSETSQFENHLRAVAGLPLGSTRMVGTAAMANIIGRIPDADDVLKIEGAHLHLYGKSEAPKRKLGHVTLRGAGADEVTAKLLEVCDIVDDRSLAGG